MPASLKRCLRLRLRNGRRWPPSLSQLLPLLKASGSCGHGDHAGLPYLLTRCGFASATPAPGIGDTETASQEAGPLLQASVAAADDALTATGHAALPAHVVFRCESIEETAMTMRRRVQLGIGLEIVGTQISNFLFHSDWNNYAIAMESFHFENSAALLGLHVFIVWRYHNFLRDALLARHVTSISIEHPAVSMESADSDARPPSAVALVETGPWTRRVELTQQLSGKRGDEVDAHGQTPFGRIFELGVLHADRARGEVVDTAGFERLLSDGMMIGKEAVATDMPRLHYMGMNTDRMVPFLVDAGVQPAPTPAEGETGETSVLERLQSSAWVQKSLHLPGGRMMDFYGFIALAMGVGSVMWWLPWR